MSDNKQINQIKLGKHVIEISDADRPRGEDDVAWYMGRLRLVAKAHYSDGSSPLADWAVKRIELLEKLHKTQANTILSLTSGGQQTGILQPWVAALGLRHQGVLMSAVRGPDYVERDDNAKALVRFYRACVLRPHCGDVQRASSFMAWPDDPQHVFDAADRFFKSIDHYNLHWFMHFVHAAEVYAYWHPHKGWVQRFWLEFYERACRKLHLNPETEEQLNQRLGADEATFAAQQR